MMASVSLPNSSLNITRYDDKLVVLTEDSFHPTSNEVDADVFTVIFSGGGPKVVYTVTFTCVRKLHGYCKHACMYMYVCIQVFKHA